MHPRYNRKPPSACSRRRVLGLTLPVYQPTGRLPQLPDGPTVMLICCRSTSAGMS